jgi:uncharacterized membrane protein SpoIIM required for sporulation
VSPVVIVVAFALISAGAFAMGLRFYRADAPREGASVAQQQRFGRLLMMSSTAMILLLVAALVRGELKVTT